MWASCCIRYDRAGMIIIHEAAYHAWAVQYGMIGL